MQQNGQHILLIEFDHPTRTLYHRELSTYYTVFACDDATNAFAVLRVEQIDMIVLEPASLRQQGWKFLTSVRAEDAWQHIPVILCSLRDERRRGLELQVSAYLIKPVLPSLLLSTIQVVLGPAAAPAMRDYLQAL